MNKSSLKQTPPGGGESVELPIGETKSKRNWSLMRDAIRAFISKDVSSFCRSIVIELSALSAAKTKSRT